MAHYFSFVIQLLSKVLQFLDRQLMYKTIVKFTQLCSKFSPTALSNFACDWLALDRDISFGLLTSPNV